MNGLITLVALVVCALVIFGVPAFAVPYPPEYPVLSSIDVGKALLMCIVLAGAAAFFSVSNREHGTFLLRIFICALLIRILLAAAIYMFRLQDFFGGDAYTYDIVGTWQLSAWGGDRFSGILVQRFVGTGEGAGWGMVYLVASVYAIIGRNMLAIQFINAVLGAVTATIIFLCAQQVFSNSRVARLSAIAVAFYPSLVLWSSQGLKDAPIVFCLALSILCTLKLGERISLKYLVILIATLFALLSLRFYVFYMLLVAIGGAFLIGMRAFTPISFIRQFALIILLGLGLTYVGVTRYANVQLESYGNLQKINVSRTDAAKSAESGFAADVDVSTTGGAISAIPIGMVYLLFAPFPWQLASLRQSITLPEMLIWWASFPMLILGIWFSLKYRMRMISPVLIFTVMLSLAYSIFQGNVGTAYRQRAQLLVFYFIFVAVGYVLMLEKREDRKKREEEEKQQALQRGPRGQKEPKEVSSF